MDWSRTAPFGILKQRLDWLDLRHQVLARNIANADTPGYVASDVEPFRVRSAQGPAEGGVRLATTAPSHLTGTLARPPTWAVRRDGDPVEATPNGNAVDLEDQMAKLNEVGSAHKLATQLYRKYLGLVRTAAGARG
ncbi:MAG TPA: flagellar biosynthesis protein FlgB [Rhodospirillales bacterium]|nr:flagellar biosynthesis protein FlgB [Rhodospirillales bacterium]